MVDSEFFALVRTMSVLALVNCFTASQGQAQIEAGPPDPPMDESAVDHLLARVSAVGAIVLRADESDNESVREANGAWSPMISEGLRQRMHGAAAGVPLDVEARIVLPRARQHVQEVSHSLGLLIVDGRARNQWIDGRESTADDVDALNQDRRDRLRADAAEHQAAEAFAWRALAARATSADVRAQLAAAGDGPGAKRMQLTPGEIAQLERIGASVGLRLGEPVPAVDTVTIAEAAASLGLSSNTPFTGDNIGIWQSELRDPYLAALQTGITIEVNGASPDPLPFINSHSTRMANIIQQTARDSHIYFSGNFGGCGDFAPPQTWTNPSVYVASHSYAGPDQSGAYSSCDEIYDNGVFDSRFLVFKAAGNISQANYSPFVWSGAKARNVVTVGDANTSGSSTVCLVVSAPSGEMNCNSAWKDPSNGTTKPDIAAPGTNFQQTIDGLQAVTSGTSNATAISAGLGAIMLEAYPVLQGSPAMGKALLIAASADFDGLPTVPLARDGYGMPNWNRISDLNAVVTGIEGPNSVGAGGHFMTLTAGKDYKVAAVWLNDGNYADATGGDPSSEWQVRVEPPCCGHYTVIGNAVGDGVRVIDYTAPVTGTYHITTTRLTNNAPSIPTVAAVAVVEH